MYYKNWKSGYLKNILLHLLFQYFTCWIPLFTSPCIELTLESSNGTEHLCKQFFFQIYLQTHHFSDYQSRKWQGQTWNCRFSKVRIHCDGHLSFPPIISKLSLIDGATYLPKTKLVICSSYGRIFSSRRK